jgi:hypothetical protein
MFYRQDKEVLSYGGRENQSLLIFEYYWHYEMKKDGIHIIGYTEQKFSEPKPVSYSNGNGFELNFSKEDEIRMGLWASDLTIYKETKNISSQLLTKNFLATLPNKYDAFSYSGRYCLIPTCPILDNPSLIILNTESLAKKELAKVALMSNQFAPDKEIVLITGYTRIFIYHCDTDLMEDIEIPFQPNEIEYAYWLDSANIRLLISSRTDKIQRIINYNIKDKHYEAFEIVSPGEVFGFEPLKEITESDTFCLFNAKGYSFASVGRLLNQWTFVDFDRETCIYKLRTNVPVSGIYYSKNWKLQGLKTIQQNVAFDFNGKGITGKENAIGNIGYMPIADEPEDEKQESNSSFWSKMKNLWF